MAAINMNVTPPDISGGVLTLGPTAATSYTFSATVPVSSYQYTGNLSNASFFSDTLTITSSPPKGTYSIVVDGLQPNSITSYFFVLSNGTSTLTFPTGRIAVRNNGDIFFTSTFSDRIIRLPVGSTTPVIFAGNGAFPYTYSDGTGTGANLPRPWGLAYDPVGDFFYFNTSNVIRRMTGAGVVTTIAGSTTAGYVDATGTSARFNGARDPDFDAAGDLIFPDTLNHRIRKLTVPGYVASTVAGSGTAGYLDSSIAANAQFNGPQGIAVNRITGDIYVADTCNFCVRKITAAGVVSTLAGSNVSGYADGVGTAARFGRTGALAWNPIDECLYLNDSAGHVRKITMGGVVTTIAGNGTFGTPTDGVNLGSVIANHGGTGIDSSGNLLILTVGGSPSRAALGTVALPGPEVRPSGARPADYTIVATTNPVSVVVPTQIIPVVTNPPIVNGVATLYKYSPFQYTFSNAVAGQSFTVTTTPELTPFVSVSGDIASFSSVNGFQTSYSSVFPITFNALFGSTVTDTFSFNVQVLPGRFFPPAAGASNTFYQNEAISPILFQSDVSVTQIYSSPTLPPGLSFAQLDVLGFQYQLQGTPLVQSPPTTYNIIGRNTQTGRIVSVSNVYRVDSERIVLTTVPSSSNISNMIVGNPITTRNITALYPTYGSYSFQYRWTQVLPPGIRLENTGGAPVVSGFSPTDLSSTIRLAGAPTLAAAQLFRTSNITSYPFTLNANLTRGGSNLTASIPFTFSFAPTVLFTQQPSNVTLYLNDIIDSNDGYVFKAGTFFTPGTVNISSIFSPNLRSDLSLQFVPWSPESSAFLVSPTGATFSEVNQPYIVRAIATNGLIRDTAVFITTQPDIVTFTPPTDLCSTFIFSRPLNQAKTGYYNSPINFRATATSGRNITYSDGGTLAGTGLSLSNVTSNNSVRLVGTPTTTLPLTNLTITAIADQTFATNTTTVQFSIIPDSATWTVTPTLPSPLEVIQNVESTPYQFRATTLSELPVAYYSSTNVPVGMNLSSTGRLTGTPTIAGSGVATITANTGASALSLPVPYTVLPDAILFVTPSNYYPITPGQPIPEIPITAFSYSGVFGSNFTLDPSGNPTYGISVTSGGTIYGTAVEQIPPTLMYPDPPIPLYVSAVAGTVSGTFAFLLGTNNPGMNPEPYLFFSNQTGPAFPPQDDQFTFYQYANTSITVTPPPYPVGEFPYLYIHPTDLPQGLQFNGLTGVISGYPTELTFQRAVTVHALQRTSQLVSSFTIYITVLNPFIVRPQTSAAAYTALIRQYTLANAAQNSRDNRVFAGAERNQGAFGAGEGTDSITQSNAGCDPNCPPVVVPVPGFSPLDIDGCALWLDAFDSAVVSGSNVLQWLDKSGGGHHANQIIGSPVYDVSAINGRPAVTLDICASLYGSLSNSSVYVTAFATYFSAPSLLLDPSFGYHPILSTGRADGTADVTLLANSGATNQGDVITLTERSTLVADIEPNNGPVLGESWYDGAIQYIASDGFVEPVSNVSTGNFAYVRYGLGNDAGAPILATLPWVGDLGEVIVYHNVLTTSNRQKVEGYLAWKWGLEGNLPGNHPYKNAPP